jgi:hypothetical protein|tara:strand:+ start:137 stop:241 length:105 start_codon:yes stop_codon:yes gene_type:complete
MKKVKGISHWKNDLFVYVTIAIIGVAFGVMLSII